MVLGLLRIVVLKMEDIEPLSDYFQTRIIYANSIERVNQVSSEVINIEETVTYLSYYLIGLSLLFTLSSILTIALVRFVLRQKQEKERHGKNQEQRNRTG